MRFEKYHVAVNLFRVIVMLTDRPHTRKELETKLAVTPRTVSRILRGVETIPIPVLSESVYEGDHGMHWVYTYRIEKRDLPRALNTWIRGNAG